MHTKLFARCKCGDGVHEQCIDKEKEAQIIREGFTCGIRRTQEVTTGVQWSASPPKDQNGVTIDDTCPINNFLTGLVLFEALQNPRLTECFPRDPQHNNLRDTMHYLQKKEFNKAQVKYYNECKEINDKWLEIEENQLKIQLSRQSRKDFKKW